MVLISMAPRWWVALQQQQTPSSASMIAYKTDKPGLGMHMANEPGLEDARDP